MRSYIPAPEKAFELKLGTGYTQGFGRVAPDRRISDVAGAGLGANLELDYRLNRRWSLGVDGQYQELNNQLNSSARGVASTLGGTYHFAPEHRGDPWMRLGAGYRLLWENDPRGANNLTVLRHGFDLAALKIGYDVRVSQDVAIAPVIGADLNMFVWEDSSVTAARALPTAQVGMFVFGGVQARFDIGGERTKHFDVATSDGTTTTTTTTTSGEVQR